MTRNCWRWWRRRSGRCAAQAPLDRGAALVRRRASVAVATSARCYQSPRNRTGWLTRSECAPVVLSTACSAKLWRVRPDDVPAGDATHSPTSPQALPAEQSTELDAFPKLLTELRRRPLSLFLLPPILAVRAKDATTRRPRTIRPACRATRRLRYPSVVLPTVHRQAGTARAPPLDGLVMEAASESAVTTQPGGPPSQKEESPARKR
jgi:hypothetical protein